MKEVCVQKKKSLRGFSAKSKAHATHTEGCSSSREIDGKENRK